MRGGHLTLDEMRACARGEDEELTPNAVEHCRECEECARQMAATLAVTHREPRTARPGMGVVGASVVLLVVVVWILAAPTFVQEQRNPSSRLATAEPPSESIVRFQVGVAAPVSEGNFLGDLQNGGMLLAKGEYKDARTLLRSALQKAPDSHEVAVYLGAAAYLDGDMSAETRQLLVRSEAVGDEAIRRLGIWYYANFLLKAGDVPEAERLLRILASAPQRYGRFAAELLEKLESHR